MLPYGSKRNDNDFCWNGKIEFVCHGNQTNPKRARFHNKKIINQQLDEIIENNDLDEIERIAQMYGDYDDDDTLML